MWGLLALILALLVVGCAFALGDNSVADVRVNTNAEADVKPHVTTADQERKKP
jgi:outer membrane PBP1 activator LpoA protein